MVKKGDWTEEQIIHYLEGIKHSDYPAVFWQRMLPYLNGCRTLTDIGSGPGAFALKAAENGFNVQAVDSSRKSLEVIEKQAFDQSSGKIKTIHGNWPDVDLEQSDVTVCAYSFGGEIGTSPGIAKIFDLTGQVIFFISPVNKVQTDFLSSELYAEEGIKPPEFKSNHHDLVDLLNGLNIKFSVEIVSYDFGFPIKNRSETEEIALYLADKLGLSSVEQVKKHLQKIIAYRNNLLWVPNPRTSALITCLRS